MAVILTGSEYIDLDAHGAALDIRTRPLSFYAELRFTSSNLMLAFSHGRGSGGRQEYSLFVNISSTGRIIGRWENSDPNIIGVDHINGYDDDSLHRVCATVPTAPATTMRLFIDGSQVDTASTGANINTRNENDLTRIGMDPDMAGREFIGQISNVAVWDTELSAGNAVDLTSGNITPGGLTTSLLGYWPLDYDARDTSGNALHGTPVNNPTFTQNPPRWFRGDGQALRPYLKTGGGLVELE